MAVHVSNVQMIACIAVLVQHIAGMVNNSRAGTAASNIITSSAKQTASTAG